MPLVSISVRFHPRVAEEITRLARANGLSTSNMVRDIVRDGIIVRAEQLTNSQFAYVEQRLHRMEDRFVAWVVKLTIQGRRADLVFHRAARLV